MKVVRAVALPALTVVALCPSPASAATIEMWPESVSYRAAPGELNDVTISPVDGGFRIRDTGAVITRHPSAEGCSISIDGHDATCTRAGLRSVNAHLDDGDDRATATTPADGDRATAPNVSLSGGEGADLLSAIGVSTSLDGGGGDDVLIASGHSAWLRGGPGNDALTGAAAQSSYDGGEGNDVLNGDSTHPQGPRCPYMEINDEMDGGDGDDTLIGGAGADRLRGGPGNDNADGGADCDVVAGDDLELWQTPDVAYAGAGSDHLSGGSEADSLYGGPGDDVIEGGEGPDALYAGLGSDSISGGGGEDQAGYHRRTAPVVASLAGGPGNGEPGENDTIAADVEMLHGGQGADRLTGNGQANALIGHGGDDVLDGAGGRFDRLAAGGGSDLILARDGDKALDGPPPTDEWGQPLTGWSMWAGRDDLITCDADVPGSAPGRDTALIDPEDTPPSNVPRGDMGCETILFGPPTTAVSPGQTTVTVPTICTDLQTVCSGSVNVSALPRKAGSSRLEPAPKWKTLGRRSFNRKGSRGRKVKVKLSRQAVRAHTRRGRSRVYVTYEYKRSRARR